MKLSIIATAALGFVNIPFFIFYGPWAIISVSITVLMLILSFLIVHRTADGEIEYKKWLGLKKYIKGGKFRSLDDSKMKNYISDGPHTFANSFSSMISTTSSSMSDATGSGGGASSGGGGSGGGGGGAG